jgi:hypothetical protein
VLPEEHSVGESGTQGGISDDGDRGFDDGSSS